MTQIAIFNCKGGVGKTTTTMNLGAAIARSGGDVCLIDLDPQGHLTRVRAEPPRNAGDSIFGFYAADLPLSTLTVAWDEIGELIPSHGQLMKIDSMMGKGPSALNHLKKGLEAFNPNNERTVLIDCCPYVGVLSLNAIFAADLVLVPVSTDYLSVQGAEQIETTLLALENVLKRRVPRRYVLTRYDRRRRMSEDVREKMHTMFGDELCETSILENTAIVESPAAGQDVFTYRPDSQGAAAYQELFLELRQQGLV